MKTKHSLPEADIHKVGIPRMVLKAMSADDIRFQWKCWCPETWREEIPAELLDFVDSFEDGAGYQWMIDIMEKLVKTDTPDLKLMEEWVNAMPSGLCRAELRAELKRLVVESTGQTGTTKEA